MFQTLCPSHISCLVNSVIHWLVKNNVPQAWIMIIPNMQGTLTTNQSSTKHHFSTIIPLSNAYKPIFWWLNPNEPWKITPILSHSSTAPYKNQSGRFFMAPNNPSCCVHPVWHPDMASTRSAASEAKWLAFLVPGTWRSWGSQCDKLGKLSGYRTDIYIYIYIHIHIYIYVCIS